MTFDLGIRVEVENFCRIIGNDSWGYYVGWFQGKWFIAAQEDHTGYSVADGFERFTTLEKGVIDKICQEADKMAGKVPTVDVRPLSVQKRFKENAKEETQASQAPDSGGSSD